MDYNELIDSNFKEYLVTEIKDMDLSCCSNSELIILRDWAVTMNRQADLLTLKDRAVGYTYNNLEVLYPMIEQEGLKRGMTLVKVPKF